MKKNELNNELVEFIDCFKNQFKNKTNNSLSFKKNKIKYCKRILSRLSNKNKYLTKISSFYEEDIRKNFILVSVAKNELKAVVIIDYDLYIFDLEKISHVWFERYRIKESFAIQKNTTSTKKGKEKLHCLQISIDYDRKDINSNPNYSEYEIRIDDEEPLNVHLGDYGNFICKGLSSKYSIKDFSLATRKNYI